VKISEGDLFSIKYPGPSSEWGRYWRKSAITIDRNRKKYKALSANMKNITSIKWHGN
jgi:hypothetical protein